MKNITKILASVTAFIGLIGPSIAPALTHYISAHPNASLIIATVSTVLALFHNPTAGA